MEPTPKYKGKPTVYLDHNILDMFTKHGIGSFGRVLINDYQVVYSDETLKEIKRSTGYENKFLEVLKNLNAHYLKLVVEPPQYTSTDTATISKYDPYVVYAEYCQSNENEEGLEHAMQQWLFKISGGRTGETIADIHDEQKAAYSTLMDSILDDIDELPIETQEQASSWVEMMKSQLSTTLQETEGMIKKYVTDDKNWNAIKDFRDHLGIGPNELNNIEPPNVLEKIWNIYKELPPYDSNASDIDDFFLLKKNPIYPELSYYNHQKVTGIYNMLNTLGYHPDSKVHKERRFVAAMSDNSHASIASFCHILISNDMAFIKKVSAAYEYLKVPTLAQHVVIKYNA